MQWGTSRGGSFNDSCKLMRGIFHLNDHFSHWRACCVRSFSQVCFFSSQCWSSGFQATNPPISASPCSNQEGRLPSASAAQILIPPCICKPQSSPVLPKKNRTLLGTQAPSSDKVSSRNCHWVSVYLTQKGLHRDAYRLSVSTSACVLQHRRQELQAWFYFPIQKAFCSGHRIKYLTAKPKNNLGKSIKWNFIKSYIVQESNWHIFKCTSYNCMKLNWKYKETGGKKKN